MREEEEFEDKRKQKRSSGRIGLFKKREKEGRREGRRKEKEEMRERWNQRREITRFNLEKIQKIDFCQT